MFRDLLPELDEVARLEPELLRVAVARELEPELERELVAEVRDLELEELRVAVARGVLPLLARVARVGEEEDERVA